MFDYIAEYLCKTGENKFQVYSAKNDNNAVRDALSVVKHSKGKITEVVRVYKIADVIY